MQYEIMKQIYRDYEQTPSIVISRVLDNEDLALEKLEKVVEEMFNTWEDKQTPSIVTKFTISIEELPHYEKV